MKYAPERFTDWLTRNVHEDDTGRAYHYHPRSSSHSISLCQFVLDDLVTNCPQIAKDAASGELVYGINQVMRYPEDPNRKKEVDLVIGEPNEQRPLEAASEIVEGQVGEVRASTEAKACMTEHSKSKPRLYDELSSSYGIVHAAFPRALATGVVVVNIAEKFISPLRNRSPEEEIEVTTHTSPGCANAMIDHLRNLRIASDIGDIGFDAIALIVVHCTNFIDEPVTVWEDEPAPQPGDPLHYESYLERFCETYTARF